MKKLAMGAALALSLVSTSSASAANWDPPNTPVPVTAGAGSLTTFGGSLSVGINCPDSSGTVTALSGATQSSAMALAPIAFNNCTEPVFGTGTQITTFGTWFFNARDTSTVDIHITGNPVATIHIPVLGCTVNVPGPVTVLGNTWNNSAHTLTINNKATFPVSSSSESCTTLFGTTGAIDATYLASAASIT